jgi:hypothetical protein
VILTPFPSSLTLILPNLLGSAILYLQTVSPSSKPGISKSPSIRKPFGYREPPLQDWSFHSFMFPFVIDEEDVGCLVSWHDDAHEPVVMILFRVHLTVKIPSYTAE